MRDATLSSNATGYRLANFNPRIPCGMRPVVYNKSVIYTIFQSTHPMRDATYLVGGRKCSAKLFQSTHPMRDATSISLRVPAGKFQSTHPMRDATCGGGIDMAVTGQFQSTHPMRDATVWGSVKDPGRPEISIHASHAGCDGRHKQGVY